MLMMLMISPFKIRCFKTDCEFDVEMSFDAVGKLNYCTHKPYIFINDDVRSFIAVAVVAFHCV